MGRFLPLLLALFVGSGCAALIYEIVWFQMLQLSIGSTSMSLGVLLGTFMGGMCIGSLLLAKYIKRHDHPLRVYAMLEGAIGVLGLIILFILPYAGGLYVAIGGEGFGGLVLRGLVSAICLLPPTILMGATLPAISRWVETTPRGVAWLGFFYGGNTAGAVLGSLVAGFYLLRVHDMTVTTLVAVAINFIVAGAAYLLSRRTEYNPPADEPARPLISIAPGSWPVYATIALSGMSALAAEVVWTRLLSLTLGATVYTFSLILAAFLIGIGLGSSVGSIIARNARDARSSLGWCQLLLVLTIGWAGYSLTQAMPYWPINPSLSPSPMFTFQIDIARCLWVVLPSSILWGASFPLALAAVVGPDEDPGRAVGTVYAANTVGAIIGALFASLFVIAAFGTQVAQWMLIGIAAISALIMLVPATSSDGGFQIKLSSAGWGLATVVLAFVAGAFIKSVPPILVAYGRYSATWLDSHGEFIYVGEGRESSVAVSRLSNGVLNYHNAGKVQASSEPQDMRLQRMLGHLTTLVPANPKSVLVIGCGAGVTAGAVSISPDVTSETIAEIEPLVPYAVSTYFSQHNYDVVRNPKVHIQIDDARHFLLTTNQKFDAVTSDPLDPWVRGAATLYTKEFFDDVKQHLNQGGIVTLFVQLYESTPEAVKSEIATFLEAFPNGMVFGNTNNGAGYDLVLLGQVEGTHIDIDAMQQKLENPRYAQVAQSLREIGFNSAIDLFSTYAGNKATLSRWLADAQINHDRNLRLQYLAGLGLNMYQQANIYRDMLQYRQYPDQLFSGSPDKLQALRYAMLQTQ